MLFILGEYEISVTEMATFYMSERIEASRRLITWPTCV
jgi:hypothetical protein